MGPWERVKAVPGHVVGVFKSLLTKKNWKRFEKLVLCLLFQLITPALPFLQQKVLHGNKIPGAVWATGASMYVLGIASSCKNRVAFCMGLVCGIGLIVLYGVDAAKVDAEALSSDPLLPSIVMAIVGATFLLDRCYYHLIRGEGFGPWEGEG